MVVLKVAGVDIALIMSPNSFQNLGIIHIAKRDTREIIKQRKLEELMTYAKLRKPHHTSEEIRRSITPTDMKKVKTSIGRLSNLTFTITTVFYYKQSLRNVRNITDKIVSSFRLMRKLRRRRRAWT